MNELVYRRVKLGLSRAKLSRKTGISAATIRSWENGHCSSLNNATKDHIHVYLDLLGIGSVSALEYILSGLYNKKRVNDHDFKIDMIKSRQLISDEIDICAIDHTDTPEIGSNDYIVPKSDVNRLDVEEILGAIYDSKCLTYTQFKALENYLK